MYTHTGREGDVEDLCKKEESGKTKEGERDHGRTREREKGEGRRQDSIGKTHPQSSSSVLPATCVAIRGRPTLLSRKRSS